MRKKTTARAAARAVKRPGGGAGSTASSRKAKLAKESKAGTKAGPELPPHVAKGSGGLGYVVENPASYRRLVSRLEESASREGDGRVEGAHLLETDWSCALCRRKTCRDNLGDLFGPHYVNLGDDLWPPFLPKPSPKARKGRDKEALYTDLWLHGDCALWSPGLLLKGPRLVGLSESLPGFWSRHCAYCGVGGASVECSVAGCSRVFHFPCGVEKGCHFREEALASYCASHASIGRKKDHKLLAASANNQASALPPA